MDAIRQNCLEVDLQQGKYLCVDCLSLANKLKPHLKSQLNLIY